MLAVQTAHCYPKTLNNHHRQLLHIIIINIDCIHDDLNYLWTIEINDVTIIQAYTQGTTYV